MITKSRKPAPAASKKAEDLDVNTLIGQYEETPIAAPSEMAPAMETGPIESPESVKETENGMEQEQSPEAVNDKLKEDLKMSYEAKGILDITYGGYGFLRQDYAINPDRDIYVSTSG